MKFSLFRHSKDNRPLPVECSWEHFVESMSAHDFTHTDKLMCPAFSPAEYRPGATRGNKGVVALHMLVLDLDEVSEDEVLSVCATIEEIGCAALLYTSWSHATKPWRCRIVIPLSRPVKPEHWESCWSKSNDLFGGVADPQCTDQARIYFGPFAPPGTEDKHFTVVFKGEPLDVDLVMELDTVELPDGTTQPRPVAKLRLEQLKQFARQSLRRKGHVADLATLLLRVCEGEVFAEPGERDTIIFKLANMLGPRFIDFDPASIAVHFAPSLQLMSRAAPDCPTVQDVEYKIERAQQEFRDTKLKQQIAKDNEYTKRIREAFQPLGIDRSDPYTEEELASFGTPYWLIQKDSSYYFFFNGAYRGPYTDKESWCVAIRELAPARTAGIELFEITENGLVQPKSMRQLVVEYGTVADVVELDLTAQKASYDPMRRAIIEAPCPVRPLTPRYHEDVDQWLQLMVSPEDYPLLCRWLASLTWLVQPLVALFLVGAKAVGKSLLGAGISRLFTTLGPTALEDVFAAFNDAFARSPICFADETLPKDFKGNSKTEELRQFIQARERPFKRKFLPHAMIKGAARVLVASNNEELLMTKANLTQEDMEAINDRYLYMRVRPEAAEFLKTVDTERWVQGDAIAEHCLWLRDNLKWEPEGRFLIKPRDNAVFNTLATRSGLRASCLYWFCMYLLDPGKFDADPRSNLLVRIFQGRVLFNIQGVYKCWDTYVSDSKTPSIGELSSAAKVLCDTKVSRPKLSDRQGKMVNYHILNIEYLILAAEQQGFAEPDQLREALKRSTEDREDAPKLKVIPFADRKKKV